MAYEVRAYQQEAVGNCLKYLYEDGRDSVLLESPVGSGKTYMALEVVHRFQKKLGRRLKIAWVAPRHRLLQQMQEANGNLHCDDILPISLFDRNPPQADLLVLDEAHHEATQSVVTLYEKIKPRWIIGLSATPMRTDRMRLSFQATVRTCSIARLIREGYLSPFNSYLIPEYTVDSVAKHYLADPNRWGKSLVFFSTISECLDFKARLADGGVACEVVTAESDKDSLIELFAQGRVPVIANVAMLTEGFDQPDISSVFARDGSRLPIIQMCGRGLRKADGKVACNVVQSANSSYQFERVASPKNAFRFQRGHWLALKDGTAAIESTLQESLRRLECRQRKEREERDEDCQKASVEMLGRFSRVIKRMVKSEKCARRFLNRYGQHYQTIEAFLRHVNQVCFDGSLPPAVVHLEHACRQWPSIAQVDEVWDKTERGPRPAITLLLARFCSTSAPRLGLELMKCLVVVARRISGETLYSESELEAVLKRLGWSTRRQKVRAKSPAERVAQMASGVLPDVIKGLRMARYDADRISRRGEIAFFDKGERESLSVDGCPVGA